MNSCRLTATITAVANALAQKLSLEQISLLAAVFVHLGDTLATIATQKGLLEANDESL